MKKVDIVLTESLNSIIGPVQTIKRIIRESEYFRENDYEIAVFTTDNIGATNIAKFKSQKNLCIVRLKEFARWCALHSKIYGKVRLDALFNETHRLLEYYNSLNRQPDIIVFHSIMDCYEYHKNFKKDNSAKTVLFTHSDGFIMAMLISYFPKLIGTKYHKQLLRKADFVMSNIDTSACIARIEEKNILDQYPQIKGKTCLVVNGIDDLTEEQLLEVEEIKKQEYNFPYRLVSAGSINGRKGQRKIIEALNKLPKELQKKISVSFVGDGPERITLCDLVKEYKLQNNVFFYGAVPNVEVYKYLAKSNICILMSEMEGLPIALLEGIRAGLAIISTNVSGIPEIVTEDYNGKLLEPSVDELMKLLRNIEKYDWKTMAVNSREVFEKQYKFTRMKEDYLNMLNKTIER